MGVLHIVLMALMALALVVAAIGDWRTRTISNGLNGAIALAAPLWWWANSYALWPDIAAVLLQTVIVFAVFVGMFALGAMGGGDVKLISALALWFPLVPFVQLLTVMAMAGGVLTIAMLVRQRLMHSGQRPEIPYGIAIALAGLWTISRTIS